MSHEEPRNLSNLSGHMTQCFPSQQEADPEDTEDPFSEDSDPFVDLADYTLHLSCVVQTLRVTISGLITVQRVWAMRD